jgi:hypothetical protein
VPRPSACRSSARCHARVACSFVANVPAERRPALHVVEQCLIPEGAVAADSLPYEPHVHQPSTKIMSPDCHWNGLSAAVTTQHPMIRNPLIYRHSTADRSQHPCQHGVRIEGVRVQIPSAPPANLVTPTHRRCSIATRSSSSSTRTTRSWPGPAVITRLCCDSAAVCLYSSHGGDGCRPVLPDRSRGHRPSSLPSQCRRFTTDDPPGGSHDHP